MRRLLLLSVLALLLTSPLCGQKNLVRGERAPDLQVREWLGAAPSTDGKAVIIEFFHSSNTTSVQRLTVLNDLANQAGSQVSVVVITREQDNAVRKILTGNNPSYFPAVDDGGKTFSAYGVSYVPYSVVIDRKGRVVWLGNPASLTYEKLMEVIK